MPHKFPFRSDLSVVARARQWLEAEIRAALPQHPTVPALIEDTLIVVSELVTNAVLHGGSTGLLQWSVEDARFMEVSVSDDEAVGWPMARWAGPEDEHGRGLFIVTRLCQRFGVEPDNGGGKRVWAKLAVDPEVATQMRGRSPARA